MDCHDEFNFIYIFVPFIYPATHHIDHSLKIKCDPAVDDFYPDPHDCSKYFICTAGSAYEVECAAGLIFNADRKICDWPRNYQCQVKYTFNGISECSIFRYFGMISF